MPLSNAKLPTEAPKHDVVINVIVLLSSSTQEFGGHWDAQKTTCQGSLDRNGTREERLERAQSDASGVQIHDFFGRNRCRDAHLAERSIPQRETDRRLRAVYDCMVSSDGGRTADMDGGGET